MDLIVGNPWGWAGLLGVGALLLIHSLQQRSRRVEIATLFLVEHLRERQKAGRRIRFLRNSWTLLLQLLAVLLLSWLLLNPYWIREDSVQTVALVLDSTASMSAFQERLDEALDESLPELESSAASTQWYLFETANGGSLLYQGRSIAEARSSLEGWRADHNHHDPLAALTHARQLAGPTARVILVTDHSERELPADVERLAIGEPLENVGFAGMKVDRRGKKRRWEVLLRNYSQRELSRRWWVENDEIRSEARDVTLAAGEILTLRGEFPGDSNSLRIRLNEDAFTLDDQLTVQRPESRKIAYAGQPDSELQAWYGRLMGMVEGAHQSKIDEANLLIERHQMLPPPVEGVPSRILFRAAASDDSEILVYPLAEEHELVKGLGWQGVRVRARPHLAIGAQDTALVWAGEVPLVFLRHHPLGEDLVINMDPLHSSLAQLPGFLVLLHRYIEHTRLQLPGYLRENVETEQPLPQFTATDKALRLEFEGEDDLQEDFPAGTLALRAPSQAGSWRIREGETTVADLAVNFADVREADLSRAASELELSPRTRELARHHSEEDLYYPLWLLAAGLLMLGAWYCQERHL